MKQTLAKITLTLILLAVGLLFLHLLYIQPIQEAQTPDWMFKDYLIEILVRSLVYAALIASYFLLSRLVDRLFKIANYSNGSSCSCTHVQQRVQEELDDNKCLDCKKPIQRKRFKSYLDSHKDEPFPKLD